MFLLRWLREYREYQIEHEAKLKELMYCESCETLKLQLAIANDEKKQLLNRILDKPKAEIVTDTRDLKPLMPAHMTWSARRQMLESESRAQAKALRDNPILKEARLESNKTSISELERELGVENG